MSTELHDDGQNMVDYSPQIAAQLGSVQRAVLIQRIRVFSTSEAAIFFEGKNWASLKQQRLAQLLGCTRQAIQNSLGALRDAGLVEVVTFPVEGHSNLYRFVPECFPDYILDANSDRVTFPAVGGRYE